MSRMASGQWGKVVAGIAVATLLAVALGVYVVSGFPAQGGATTTVTQGGIVVYANNVVTVRLPGLRFSEGVWQLDIGNAGGLAAYATYQINVNGVLAYGNSTTLQPGQRSNITSCLTAPVTSSTTFDVSAFIINSSGLVAPHYPVTLVNTTEVPFSGQFSASSSLQANVHSAEAWSTAVTNTGKEPIQYLYAELQNGTSVVALDMLRCAGVAYTPLAGSLYSNQPPLLPGESVNGTNELSSTTSITAGALYTVVVAAVYADFTEVVQTYSVVATS